MTRLILLEDEPVLRGELADYLIECGHVVDSADTIDRFLQVFSPCDHLIAILDLGLPDGDGIDLIDWLRKQGRRLGIIVVSARSSTAEKVHGLQMGADHYISKPLELDELAATIAALSRRLNTGGASMSWVLDVCRRQISPPGQAPINLTAQSALVLHAIALGHGLPVSRKQIVQALGENYLLYDQRRLDTQMHQLRKTIFAASGVDLPVRTARGRGYHFVAEVELK